MLYTIEDKTLTAMGDAIRSYTGVLIETTTEAPEPFWSYDIEISGADMSGWTESTSSYSYTVVIPQKEILGDCWDVAKYLEYSFIYDNTDSNNATDISIKMYTDETYASGSYSTPIVSSNKYYSPLPYSYTGSTALGNIKDNGWWELRFNVPKRNFTTTDTITFHLDLWVKSSSTEYVTPKKYTPLEMVDEVYGIIDDFANAPIIPEEALTITGNCENRFAYGGWDWFIEGCGNRITTKDITNLGSAFNASKVSSIPFDLNINSACSTTTGVFSNCSKLQSAPYIIGPERTPLTSSYGWISTQNIFAFCWCLKYIPKDYFWEMVPNKNYWEKLVELSSGGAGGTFRACYSLREHPDITMLGSATTSAYSSLYADLFTDCYTLDKVENMPILRGSLTSNTLGSLISNCYRIKDFTFVVNEDGTPKTANWKSQTLDFSSKGYAPSYYKSYLLNYNSGITADKEVKDDATYQALKDDPDWFTVDINYSRYNHDSAVNTINSLPDCSATGTNTIKFQGAAGAKTDGGAISNLTEEEIAVAAAKGWTVSLS